MNKILTVLAALSVWTALGANTWYVDDDNYGKTGMTGATEALAYGTIQEAIDAETTLNNDTIVVLPGVYGRGDPVQAEDGSWSRVSLGKFVSIVSRDGAAATHIVGKKSTSSNGLGSDAIRCIDVPSSVGGRTKIVGFTIRDGATPSNGTGGGVRCPTGGSWNLPAYVVDCVVSNCAAYNGGAGAFCIYVRTWVTKNFAANEGPAGRWCYLTSSVVSENDGSKAGNALKDPYDIIGSTICNNIGFGLSSPSKAIRNSVFFGNTKGDATAGVGNLYNCVTESPASQFASVSACANGVAEPICVDPTSGDFRLLAGSAATDVADAANQTSCDSWLRISDYVTKDFLKGVIPSEGHYNAGAVLTAIPVKVCTVSVENGGVKIIGGKNGTNLLEPDDVITFEPEKSGNRPCAGLVVNGVTVWFREVPSYSIGGGDIEGSLTVSALYTNDWYVDAVHGSDDNSGFYQGAAFRTLAYAMGKAVSGDTVHALPGTYDEGTMLQSRSTFGGDVAHTNRVTVSQGKTLIADFGPERTVIVGAPDPAGEENYGAGPAAIRCAYVDRNATLSGFTLTRGCADSSGTTDKAYGGAVLGESTSNSIVENCIISNNVARNAAAGAYCTFRRCRIIQNRCTSLGIVYQSSLYNSLFDDNVASRQVYNCADIVNCTFGRRITSSSASYPELLYYSGFSGAQQVKNTLFYYIAPAGSGSTVYDHCAFHYSKVPDATCIDCISTNASSLASDEVDYRPVLGQSVTIDAGDTDLYDEATMGSLDLAGNPRILNDSRIDIGCHEFDWRGEFARRISPRALTIVEMSADVSNDCASGIRIPAGGFAVLDWAQVGQGEISLLTDAEGALKVLIDGVETLPVEEGIYKIAPGAAGAHRRVEVSYESDEGAGAAYLQKMSFVTGMSLILR